jgi:hypothetical protein
MSKRSMSVEVRSDVVGQACSKRGADVRPHFGPARMGKDAMKLFSVAALSIVVCPRLSRWPHLTVQCQQHWPIGAKNRLETLPRAQRNLPISNQVTGHDKQLGISKKPSRDKLKKINTSTYQYTAKARYRGADAFAIMATGKDEKTSGTSVISVGVTIK